MQKFFESPSFEKIYVQTNHWLEFSRTEAHLHLATPCFARDAHTHTLDKHAQWVVRNVIRGQPPRVKGILVLEQHRSICKGQSRRNFPHEVRIKSAINNPADFDLGGGSISCLCITVTVNLVFFERFYQRTPPRRNNRTEQRSFNEIKQTTTTRSSTTSAAVKLGGVSHKLVTW